MKAIVYDNFGAPPELRTVPDPTPPPDGVVLDVEATGVCRSDWHGWQGHDPMIEPPHVPGHEVAGTVADVGANVDRWSGGERVTVPFVGGCGTCAHCRSGDPQVCPNQFQPGFSAPGAFAEYVAIDYADANLVPLPPSLDAVTAASLGCRFATAFRAIIDQGDVRGGDWVAVHGCGGVGLSAVMVASAVGAQVVAVDISDDALALASEVGAAATINAEAVPDVVEAVRECTRGGAHVSLDALGSAETAHNSVTCLRKRGRHVQVGLLVDDEGDTALPMDRVVADELEIRGTHGIAAHRYPAMFEMIEAGALKPSALIRHTIPLADAGTALTQIEDSPAGVTVVALDDTPAASS